jgi:hypothetical protein
MSQPSSPDESGAEKLDIPSQQSPDRGAQPSFAQVFDNGARARATLAFHMPVSNLEERFVRISVKINATDRSHRESKVN